MSDLAADGNRSDGLLAVGRAATGQPAAGLLDTRLLDTRLLDTELLDTGLLDNRTEVPPDSEIGRPPATGSQQSAASSGRLASQPRWQSCRWAIATVIFGLTSLVSTGALGASISAPEATAEQPMIAPSAPQATVDEPQSRWRDPTPAVPAGAQALTFPHFTGPEFNALFTTATLANLLPISALPTITDSAELDARIRAVATERGYQRRPLPADNAQMLLIDDGLALQRPAAAAWRALRQDAADHGFALRLDSAYRGHEYQRQVFLRPLRAPYVLGDLAERLKLSAPPGYSKHHTGYAIDIGQVGYRHFGSSPAYRWLSDDNFANAKRHGWIPSYPPDGGRQGPVPEPWEFTYVGVEAILCFHQPLRTLDALCAG